jgi:hypothetical protein
MSALRSIYFSLLLVLVGVPFSLSNSNFLHVQRGLALKEGFEQARKVCPEKITKRMKVKTFNRIKSLLNPSGIHSDPLRRSYLEYVPSQGQINIEVDSLCGHERGSTTTPVYNADSEAAVTLDNTVDDELVSEGEFEELYQTKKGRAFFSTDNCFSFVFGLFCGMLVVFLYMHKYSGQITSSVPKQIRRPEL